jgi:predicted dehydrogenase
VSDTTYRVGVVGLSGISAGRTPVDESEVLRTPLPTSHVAAYAALPQTSVVAVCDLKPEQRAAFTERWGDVFPEARAYADVREMLDREDLDLLSVVTPDHAHADIVVAAAGHGVRGIACEKPLATSVADCDRMIAACAASGTVLSVDHTRRFRAPYQAARQAIRRGAIGRVQRIIASMGGPRAMLFRNGTHLIDGVCFFAESDPEWVFAELDPGFEDYAVYRGDGGRDPATDPGGSGYVHFRDGVRAFVNCSKGQSPAFILQVIGEQGEIDVAMDHAVLRQGTHQAELLSPPLHVRTGIAAYLEELIRVMEQGGETSSSPREARKTVEIIVGFLTSQARGSARVDFPLPPGS